LVPTGGTGGIIDEATSLSPSKGNFTGEREERRMSQVLLNRGAKEARASLAGGVGPGRNAQDLTSSGNNRKGLVADDS